MRDAGINESHDTAVSSDSRYRYIGDSMRVVARREPTLAPHVHEHEQQWQGAREALSANRSPPGSPARICENLPFEVDRRYESPSRAV